MNDTGKNLKFGQVLRDIRNSRELSVRQFALKCEVSAVYISDLENNNRKATMSVINKICNNICLTDQELQSMMDAFTRDRLDIPVELLYYLIDNDLIESLKIIKETDKKGVNIKKLALELNCNNKDLSKK